MMFSMMVGIEPGWICKKGREGGNEGGELYA